MKKNKLITSSLKEFYNMFKVKEVKNIESLLYLQKAVKEIK